MDIEDSELATYLGKGDNRNARLHTKMVAGRLNRLPSNVTDDNARELRQKIREDMLWALTKMPLRDEVGTGGAVTQG